MSERAFDARSMAQDQQRRVAAAAAIGLNAAKPMIYLQASLLRLWADNAELFARNYEKGLETFSPAVEDDQQQRAA